MYVAIDVETENTGCDVMKDNKRIISIQIGDDTKQELYYADSQKRQYTLSEAKSRIAFLLSQGCTFVGYNIKGFDIPILKQFLDIKIPESNIFDLFQTPKVVELKSKKKFKLEDICMACGIEANHKRKMNEKADKYKDRQDIKDQACAKAKDIAKRKGGTLDFAYHEALDKIARGTAIIDAYVEFVESGGQKTTLFYEYAVGDIISEYKLFEKLVG